MAVLETCGILMPNVSRPLLTSQQFIGEGEHPDSNLHLCKDSPIFANALSRTPFGSKKDPRQISSEIKKFVL
jgi:hypothetical protein